MTEPLRILILEDNPNDAELIQFELEEAGFIFTSKVVMTEKDFIHEIQEFCPDLILSDYDLPTYNGALALAEARRQCPDTPFILVTGAVTEDRAIEILTQGAKDYVLKSRLQQRLVSAIKRVFAEVAEHKERKKAEQELRTASLYSRSLIEASLDPFVTISTEGKMMDVNKATEEITGVSRNQLIGSDFSDYFTDPEKARAGYKKVFSDGSIKDYPLAIRHITGRITDVLYNATIYENEKGEIQGIFAAARDVTELKKAEEELREAHRTLEERVKIRTAELEAEIMARQKTDEALRESEAQFRALADTIPNLAWWATGDGYLTWYNRRWYEYTGTTPEQMEGWGWQSVHDPKVLPEVLKRWTASLATGQPFDMDFPLRGADGVFRPFLTRVIPVKDSAGRVLRWFGTNTDISTLKQAEEKLRDSEQRYRELVHLSPEAVIVHRDGQFLYANPAALRLYGAESLFQLQRKTVLDLIPVDERRSIASRMKQGKAGERLSLRETKLMRLDGQVISVESVGGAVTYDGQPAVQIIIRDITERKQAENELRRREHLLQDVINGSTSPIFLKDVDGKFLTINASLERMLGKSREEIKGKTDYDIAPKEVADYWRTHDKKVLDTGKAIQIEEVADLQDGHHVFLADKFPLVDADGQVYGVGAISHDITERKNAENELQITFQRFNTLISNINSAILLISEKRIAMANQAFCDNFGLPDSPEDLIGITPEQMMEKIRYAYLHPEKELIRIREIVDRNESVMGEEIAMHDGRTCIRDYIPIYIDGIFYGHLWNHTDITERKQAEEALRESEEKYKSLVKYAPAAIYETDLQGTKFFSVNEAMCSILGYSQEELLSMKPADLLDEEGRSIFQERIRKNLAGEKIDETIEYRIRRKDGEWINVAVNYGSYTYTNKETMGVVVIAYDITNQKKAEILLSERTLELENINRELESFSYSVSHDLKAPLRAINGYSRMLLKKDIDNLSEDAIRKLDAIRNNTAKMTGLIDDLLSFSKALKTSITISEINMDKLVKEVWTEILAANTERELELKITDILPGQGDPTLIRQVLVNLLSNAVKFTNTRKHGVIKVSCYSENSNVVYSINDNGVGFDMTFYDKLFGVFQRLHSNAEYEGTGVGLAIVHRIINRHSGRVWAEAKVDEGATFYFSLPSKQT